MCHDVIGAQPRLVTHKHNPPLKVNAAFPKPLLEFAQSQACMTVGVPELLDCATFKDAGKPSSPAFLAGSVEARPLQMDLDTAVLVVGIAGNLEHFLERQRLPSRSFVDCPQVAPERKHVRPATKPSFPPPGVIFVTRLPKTFKPRGSPPATP